MSNLKENSRDSGTKAPNNFFDFASTSVPGEELLISI